MYQIAIPSYKRANELKEKTLMFLENNGIEKECITIFVANKEEHDIYSSILPSHNIVIGEPTIKAQRNFISNYYPLDTWIVSIDDDIEDLYKLKDGILEPIRTLNDIILMAFILCKKTGRNLWGIYPIMNAYFMREIVSTEFKFIIGHFFGYINKRLLITQPIKEDYELSALYSDHDGGVIRFNSLCAKTKMYARGGVGSKANRKEANKESCEYLVKRYPQYYMMNNKKVGELRTRPPKRLR